MKIEATKEGLKVTHPSGLVSVHSKKVINEQIQDCERRIAEAGSLKSVLEKQVKDITALEPVVEKPL